MSNGSSDAVSIARQLLDDDAVASSLGMSFLDAGVGRAILRLVVRSDMINGAGKCHGGVIFSLADVAFQCACNTHGRLTVSAGASIQYVRAASLGDELIADCVERYRNRSGGGYDVTVTRVSGPSMEADTPAQTIALFRGQAHELRARSG